MTHELNIHPSALAAHWLTGMVDSCAPDKLDRRLRHHEGIVLSVKLGHLPQSYLAAMAYHLFEGFSTLSIPSQFCDIDWSVLAQSLGGSKTPLYTLAEVLASWRTQNELPAEEMSAHRAREMRLSSGDLPPLQIMALSLEACMNADLTPTAVADFLNISFYKQTHMRHETASLFLLDSGSHDLARQSYGTAGLTWRADRMDVYILDWDDAAYIRSQRKQNLMESDE